jgi:hypothetical protein
MRRRIISVTRRHLEFLFNREETVMCSQCMQLGSACGYHAKLIRVAVDDTELQLPSTDDSHVGEDVD